MGDGVDVGRGVGRGDVCEGFGAAVDPGAVGEDDGTPVLAPLDGEADGDADGVTEREGVGVAADLVVLREAADVERVAVGSLLAEGSEEVATSEGLGVVETSSCPTAHAGEFAASGASSGSWTRTATAPATTRLLPSANRPRVAARPPLPGRPCVELMPHFRSSVRTRTPRSISEDSDTLR